MQPSSQPSSQPTAQPSSQPSGRPTGQPSTQPSSKPTSSPTTPAPSFAPTKLESDIVIVQATFKIDNVAGNFSDYKSQLSVRQAVARVSNVSVSNVEFVSATPSTSSAVRTNSFTDKDRFLNNNRRMLQAATQSWNVKTVTSYNLVNYPQYRNSPNALAADVSQAVAQSVQQGVFTAELNNFAKQNQVPGLANATSDQVVVVSKVIAPPSENNENTLSDGEITAIVICVVIGAVGLFSLVYYFLINVRKSLPHTPQIIPVHRTLTSQNTMDLPFDSQAVVKKGSNQDIFDEEVVMIAVEGPDPEEQLGAENSAAQSSTDVVKHNQKIINL
jgi:hypothetical protein